MFAVQIQLPEIQLVNDAVLIVWKYKLIQNESETEHEKERIMEDDVTVHQNPQRTPMTAKVDSLYVNLTC